MPLYDDEVNVPLDVMELADARRGNNWKAIAAWLPRLRRPFVGREAALAEEIAFALGQMRKWDEAIQLTEELYALAPSHKLASSLAYLHYAALMDLDARPRDGSAAKPEGAALSARRDSLRDGFRRWMDDALNRRPTSVKDLYRLGIFEARLCAGHDRAALRAFLAAIHSYEQGRSRGTAAVDLRVPYVRSLYAGARSALRIGDAKVARRLSFTCIREDEERNLIEPVFKLGQGARVCLVSGDLEAAERGARLALGAPGPPARDYLYGLLAEITLRRGDLVGAEAWIDVHVPAERRTPALWRLQGDIRFAAGRLDEARAAFRSSLLRDRAGRHLTLVRLGRLDLAAGRLADAARAFEDARAFRRRTYMSDDPDAVAALAMLAEQREAAKPGLAKCAPPADPSAMPGKSVGS